MDEVAAFGIWVRAAMGLLKKVAVLGIAKRALQAFRTRRTQRSRTRPRRN